MTIDYARRDRRARRLSRKWVCQVHDAVLDPMGGCANCQWIAEAGRQADMAIGKVSGVLDEVTSRRLNYTNQKDKEKE